jgi:hypothetical protein
MLHTDRVLRSYSGTGSRHPNETNELAEIKTLHRRSTQQRAQCTLTQGPSRTRLVVELPVSHPPSRRHGRARRIRGQATSCAVRPSGGHADRPGPGGWHPGAVWTLGPANSASSISLPGVSPSCPASR